MKRELIIKDLHNKARVCRQLGFNDIAKTYGDMVKRLRKLQTTKG